MPEEQHWDHPDHKRMTDPMPGRVDEHQRRIEAAVGVLVAGEESSPEAEIVRGPHLRPPHGSPISAVRPQVGR